MCELHVINVHFAAYKNHGVLYVPTTYTTMSVRRRECAIPNALAQPAPTNPTSVDAMSAFAELTSDEHKVIALEIEPGKLKPLQHLNEAAYKQHLRAGNFSKELIEQIEAHKRIAAGN